MKHDETNVQQTDRDRSVWSIQTWKAGRVKLDDSDSEQRAEFQCSDFFFASCLLAHDFDQDACFINFGSLTSYQQTSSQWRLQQNYHHNQWIFLAEGDWFLFLPYHPLVNDYVLLFPKIKWTNQQKSQPSWAIHTKSAGTDAGAAAHFQHAGGRLRQQARIQNVKRGIRCRGNYLWRWLVEVGICIARLPIRWKPMISMKHFFLLDAFWLLVACKWGTTSVLSAGWETTFLLGNPIFRGHPPPWGWSRARCGGWWRRHGDVGRFGGEPLENACVGCGVGAQVMCFFWGVLYTKKQEKTMGRIWWFRWWVWNLLMILFGVCLEGMGWSHVLLAKFVRQLT